MSLLKQTTMVVSLLLLINRCVYIQRFWKAGKENSVLVFEQKKDEEIYTWRASDAYEAKIEIQKLITCKRAMKIEQIKKH